MTAPAIHQLSSALAACATHLTQHANDLQARGQGAAAECARAIALLTREALESASIAGTDRRQTLLSVASLHAMHGGNGFGESIIWPAYRRAGMHRPCEEWTALTNQLRQARLAMEQLKDCTQNSKVLFQRGPMTFIGEVVAIAPDKITVSGVEVGCMAVRRHVVDVEYLVGLRVLSADEWDRQIANEPAFADTMSRERFVELQAERELLELCVARGEGSDATEHRMDEINLLMENAPWVMDPDEGCMPAPAAPSRPSLRR